MYCSRHWTMVQDRLVSQQTNTLTNYVVTQDATPVTFWPWCRTIMVGCETVNSLWLILFSPTFPPLILVWSEIFYFVIHLATISLIYIHLYITFSIYIYKLTDVCIQDRMFVLYIKSWENMIDNFLCIRTMWGNWITKWKKTMCDTFHPLEGLHWAQIIFFIDGIICVSKVEVGYKW